jgi:hypothetical protein
MQTTIEIQDVRGALGKSLHARQYARFVDGKEMTIKSEGECTLPRKWDLATKKLVWLCSIDLCERLSERLASTFGLVKHEGITKDVHGNMGMIGPIPSRKCIHEEAMLCWWHWVSPEVEPRCMVLYQGDMFTGGLCGTQLGACLASCRQGVTSLN